MIDLKVVRIANKILAKTRLTGISKDAVRVLEALDGSLNPVEDIRLWVESLDLDCKRVNSLIYELSSLFASFVLYGRSVEDGVTSDLVDPLELEMGVKVEMEHTSSLILSERIALDHLAEAPLDAPLKYYTALHLMEKMIDDLSNMDRSLADSKIEEFKGFVSGLNSNVVAKQSDELDLGNNDKDVEVSFKIRGSAKEMILKMLTQLQSNGSIGHTCDIKVDEDGGDNYRKYEFDGDGADRISDIKVDGDNLPFNFKW